jgi:hypothetical protein
MRCDRPEWLAPSRASDSVHDHLGSTGSTATFRSARTHWCWTAATFKTAGAQLAKAIFTDCEARLVYSYNGHDYDTEVEVMFVDFQTGDCETGLVISADHPELATISLGMDKLWNRVITLTVLPVLLGGLGVGMIFLTLRIWRVKSQLRQPAILMPVHVEITAA